MCGIIGVFGGGKAEADRLRQHVDELKHRGPDLQVVADGREFAFGHTLLSIIGTSPIQQPIASKDQAITLAYNGEVYNYLELLEDDEALQARCSGSSDTEVLVEGLSLYGIDFVDRLNGIFAFAAFDQRTRTGYLVRDRLGVKPLYFARVGDLLYFASELRPLLHYSGVSAEPDAEAFYSYARFRYPLGERTYAKAARMVEPGSFLRIQNGAARANRYWTIDVPAPFHGTYETARDAIRELLSDAIRIQMRSDHSFCTYLSGGLDSSYLTAIAKQAKPELDTYSIEFSDADYDESVHSRQVAKRLNTKHHPYLLDRNEYIEQHEEFVKHLASPISVPNQVALKILSRELAIDHRCVLSGEGADEVFGGYGRIFLLPYDWERLVKARDSGGASASAFLSKIEARYGTVVFPDYLSFFVHRYGYLTHEEAVEALQTYFPRPALDAAEDVLQAEIHALFDQWETDIFTRQLLLFQKMHLPGLLLRVDTATMAHAVEGRVPFLDHRLVELLNSLPIEFRMKRKKDFMTAFEQGLLSDELSETYDIPKAPLKEIAEEILPESVVWRKKLGFPIPSSYYDVGNVNELQPPYVKWVQRNLALLSGSDIKL